VQYFDRMRRAAAAAAVSAASAVSVQEDSGSEEDDETGWSPPSSFVSSQKSEGGSHDEDDSSWYGRPMILSKFGKPDWRPGMTPEGHAESAAQHRYPVWWTGDYVDLEASLESMVDAGAGKNTCFRISGFLGRNHTIVCQDRLRTNIQGKVETKGVVAACRAL
jgi:hypothetical protein